MTRYAAPKSVEDVREVLAYIFPRQYGLHNVFTAQTDKKQTAMRVHDYTLRDIKSIKRRPPKRLGRLIGSITSRMLLLHRRCPYSLLLAHYAPLPGTGHSQADAASSHAQVCAFVAAVFFRVLPRALLGSKHNWETMMKRIQLFIRASKYEKLSLQNFLEGLRVTDMDWLRPAKVRTTDGLSTSDRAKRYELLAEFVYWLVDGFLIPLVRSHFYVTETSGLDGASSLYYFRQDVWSQISRPALATLRNSMFEHIPEVQAKCILSARELTFSKLRLLPKKDGMRCIANLKRKPMVETVYGRKFLGKSVNEVLKPDFNVLKFESVSQTNVPAP